MGRRKSDKWFYQAVAVGLLAITGLNMYFLASLHNHIKTLDQIEAEAQFILRQLRSERREF